MTREELLSAALALPAHERAELAYQLLVSLHETDDGSAPQAWVEELARRAQTVSDGTAKLVTWDEARARISARLQSRKARRSKADEAVCKVALDELAEEAQKLGLGYSR